MEMIIDFPGGSRVDAHFGSFIVPTDQPPTSSAPSPFATFLASIGTCAGIYVLGFCQQRGIPPTGTENFGGTIVTAGGLVFIGGTKDERFRAFDKHSGKVLWEHQLNAGGYATPCTFAIGGRQFVVIAAGGGKWGAKSGGSYVAFALP